jgi:hypothetical protein
MISVPNSVDLISQKSIRLALTRLSASFHVSQILPGSPQKKRSFLSSVPHLPPVKNSVVNVTFGPAPKT